MSDVEELRDRVRAAAAEYQHLRVNLENARERLLPLVIEELKHPELLQKDVISDSGLTREYVRRIARKAGIEPRG